MESVFAMALHDHPMWRKPQHHQDIGHAHDHVHWTELFYDLIHVVTIFLLGNYLSHHLHFDGFLVFCGMFIVLWYAWGELSVFNSIYVSTDFWHRVIADKDQQEGDFETALELMKDADALSLSMEKAHEYVALAKQSLAHFPDGEMKTLLSDLADFTVSRAF